MVYVIILSIIIPVPVISLFLLLRTSLLVVTVQGDSMAPTLHQGNRVLVLRRWLAGRPRKGQIVVVVPPGEVSMSSPRFYMKRVVATAGECFSAQPDINTDTLEDAASQESLAMK